MIISFSGLGGSGKSTQIAILKDRLVLQGKRVKVVALREMFLFPKVSLALRSGDQPAGTPSSVAGDKRYSFIKSIYLFFRDLFYIFDAIRIGVLVKIIHASNDIVIFDRAVDDFILELDATSAWKGMHQIMAYFVPSPRLRFYFSIDSQTVFNRKAEDTISVLSERESSYEAYFSKKKDVRISAGESIQSISEILVQLVQDASHSRGTFSLEGYVLYMLSVKKNQTLLATPVLLIDPTKLLRVASKNRMALFFLSAIHADPVLKSKYWQDGWNKYWSYAEAMLMQRATSLQKMKEMLTGLQYSLVKNDDGNTDLSSDIDVLFGLTEEYRLAVGAFQKEGSVVFQSSRKADGYVEGMVPVDLHLGLTFGSFEYFPKSILNDNNPNLGATVVIAHAVAELTLVTLGDVIKTSSAISDAAFKSASRHIAALNGWSPSYDSWLIRASRPDIYGYNFPIAVPVGPLVISRLGLYARSPLRIGGLAKELYLLALSIRARLKGFVPFHDQWIDTVK